MLVPDTVAVYRQKCAPKYAAGNCSSGYLGCLWGGAIRTANSPSFRDNRGGQIRHLLARGVSGSIAERIAPKSGGGLIRAVGLPERLWRATGRTTEERTRSRRSSGCDREAGHARHHFAPYREYGGITPALRPDGRLTEVRLRSGDRIRYVRIPLVRNVLA
jgi:hypothetical protein